jgi:hypothetical protein
MSKTIELEFKVPTRLSDLTLEQLQRFRAVTDKVEEKSEESESFINLKALEIFCGLQLKDSYNLPLSSFGSLIENINKCLAEPTPLVKRFWFRGNNGTEVEFGMNPNISNISFGEYVDLDNYMSDFKNMHKAMAVLYRPITKKHKELYEIEAYESSEKYAGHMLHMPANVAMGAIVFFYRLGMKLSKATIHSLYSQMGEEQQSQVESKFLEQNGVGINQFMHSLEAMSSNLTALQNLRSTSASRG